MNDNELAIRYIKQFKDLQQRFIDMNNDIISFAQSEDLCKNLRIENEVYKSNILLLEEIISILEK